MPIPTRLFHAKPSQNSPPDAVMRDCRYGSNREVNHGPYALAHSGDARCGDRRLWQRVYEFTT